MNRYHRPERTCLGCGARDDQAVLLRFTVQDNGELQLDSQGRGRGGYLHKSDKCWEAFLRKKSLYRAFHVEVKREAREKLVRNLRNRE